MPRVSVGKDPRNWIHHLAAGADSHLVLAAHFEQTVNVWDLASRKNIGAFETHLDIGGKRLALSPDGSVCFAGAYRRYGIAAYLVASGIRVWERRDLKAVQYVSLSPGGRRVYCGLSSRPLHVLDSKSGETLEQLHGIRQVTESPFDASRLLDGTRLTLVRPGRKSRKIERGSFAVLDAAFSPGCLLLSESDSRLRCIDLDDGVELWSFRHRSAHALDVAFAPALNAAVTLVGHYGTVRGGYNIFRLDMDTGSPTHVARAQYGYAAAFCDHGRKCVLADGSVVSTEDRKTVFRFPLPPYSSSS